MVNARTQRWTGFLGVVVFVLGVVVLPLYFTYSGPPPIANVLTRILVNMLACVALIAFLVGFRELILEARADCTWLGTLAFTFGLVFVTLTFVADSIQVGAVLGTKGEMDPTMIGGGGEGSILIFGPMARLLTALFLITAAAAILATHVLPTWTARMAQAVAVFHLAMVPSLFSGTLPAHFYSINGWNIPVAGGLFLTWILGTSIVILRPNGGSARRRASHKQYAAEG
jgi:hypothetical protein